MATEERGRGKGMSGCGEGISDGGKRETNAVVTPFSLSLSLSMQTQPPFHHLFFDDDDNASFPLVSPLLQNLYFYSEKKKNPPFLCDTERDERVH